MYDTTYGDKSLRSNRKVGSTSLMRDMLAATPLFIFVGAVVAVLQQRKH